jgi:thioredoxin 1
MELTFFPTITTSKLSETINQGLPVVLQFLSRRHGPCRLQVPITQAIMNEANGQYVVSIIDPDESPEVIKSLGIHTLPTTLIFREGQEVHRFYGYQNRATIADHIFE